jgi:RNA methyltransferase, TrmH family
MSDAGAALSATELALLRRAQRDPGLVILEGMHALKHAIRFGADIQVIASPEPAELARLLARLAPDIRLTPTPGALDAGTWQALTGGRVLPSPCLAVATRPAVSLSAMLARPGRILLLEQPRHLGNVGAVIRVAAAATLAGVIVLGELDPWHPTVVRAAAGLQFAVAVARLTDLAELEALRAHASDRRPLIALDPDGVDIEHEDLALDAIVAIGTERDGLSDALRRHCEHAVAIPMRDGVSSLNLATAAAVVAYRR